MSDGSPWWKNRAAFGQYAMITPVFKRLLSVLPVLFGISLLSFALIDFAPGDPAEMLMRQSGGQPTREAIDAFKEKLGMNAPLPVRYIKWLRRAVCLDFGKSLASGEDVIGELSQRMPETLKLSVAAFIFTLLVSVTVGIISGLRQNGAFDHVARLWSIFSIAIPNYWLGLVLLYLFSLKLHIFRIVGGEGVKDLVLPAVTLGLYASATNSRLIRERIIEVLAQDYIKLAHAKGLPMRVILWRHVAKNALLPLVTLWGMTFGYLLGGSVIVESVFAWPGVGKLAVDAIGNRDFPVLQAYIVLMALIFVGLNFIVDTLYQFLDPRIRAGMRGDK
jgi:peptide/nickel transport system permease protein